MARVDQLGNDEEIVQFPVPKRFLPVVIQALAHAMDTRPLAGSPMGNGAFIEERVSSLPAGHIWTRSDIARLKSEHLPVAARAAIDLVSERPRDHVPFADVIDRAGVTHDQARAQLGALTKLLNRRYGGAAWPFEVKFGTKGEAMYRSLSDEVARWWLEEETAHHERV